MRKSNSKRKLTLTLSLALAAILLIGGTLAYLTTQTNTKINPFSVDSGIEAELEEEQWEAVGKDKAEETVPGKQIEKDPKITNKGSVDVYVAMLVSFEPKAPTGGYTPNTTIINKAGTQTLAYGSADYLKLEGLLDIYKTSGYTSTGYELDSNWTKIDSTKYGDIYMYNAKVLPAASTTTLFDYVRLGSRATTSDMEWIESMGGYNITLYGEAVQADELTAAEAETLLKAQFKDTTNYPNN